MVSFCLSGNWSQWQTETCCHRPHWHCRAVIWLQDALVHAGKVCTSLWVDKHFSGIDTGRWLTPLAFSQLSKHSPWEVLLRLDGKCLSLWPETARALHQSPQSPICLMVCYYALACNAGRLHGWCGVLSFHVYQFHCRIYTLIKKKSLLETVY